MESIVEYLHVDPLQDGDPTVLRFLLKEWKVVQTTLHTIGTMEGLKQKPLDMKVPYLRRAKGPVSQSARLKWEYWNDYSQGGMEKFHAENSQEQEAHGLPMDTSSVERNQETLDHQSETEEVSDTADAEDTLQEDDDSYQNPVPLASRGVTGYANTVTTVDR